MSLSILARPSPNWNARRNGQSPDMLILHYTGMTSAEAALERLCDPSAKVSSHYLIDRDGVCVQLVPEEARAWHAGLARWHGETDINSRSIGIELVNPGHAHGYIDFPQTQMVALLRLLSSIHSRHTIPAAHVLAHSDIAPARKQDPGERFDWRLLSREGFGLWVEPAAAGPTEGLDKGPAGSAVEGVQRDLAALGYGLVADGQYGTATKEVVTAFQRHWRQERVDGIADAGTHETIRRVRRVVRSVGGP